MTGFDALFGGISSLVASVVTARQWPTWVKFGLAGVLAGVAALVSLTVREVGLTAKAFAEAFTASFTVQQATWQLGRYIPPVAVTQEVLLNIGSGTQPAPGEIDDDGEQVDEVDGEDGADDAQP